VAGRPKPVMGYAEVEDQTPAPGLISKIVADLHVAAPLACAGRHSMLCAHDGTLSSYGAYVRGSRFSGEAGENRHQYFNTGCACFCFPLVWESNPNSRILRRPIGDLISYPGRERRARLFVMPWAGGFQGRRNSSVRNNLCWDGRHGGAPRAPPSSRRGEGRGGRISARSAPR